MNYRKYQLKTEEWIQVALISVGLSGILSYLFYDSFVAMVILFPVGYGVFKRRKEKAILQRRQRLTEQFKDTILAVATALRSGYSPENAFKEALKDMQMNYPKEAEMIGELYSLQRKLASNMLLEDILMDFAKRSRIEDIEDFSRVFAIAKRKGGDLSQIIQNTVSIISDKIEVRREIQTMLAAKQFEQTIMNLIPIFIVFYIRSTSPGFFDPLYHNLFGICFMTVCLIIYAIAYFISQKIVNIEV